MKEFPAEAMHKIGESEKQNGDVFGAGASSYSMSQQTTTSDDVDLKCKERVCDSETENETETEESFENRSFPQQRFSPAISRHPKNDVTHKPKPIKVLPHGDDAPRPTSQLQSNFTKTGAVFKDVNASFRFASNDVTMLSDERPSSAKSDSAVTSRDATMTSSKVTSGASVDVDLLRSHSVESRIRSFHNVSVNPTSKRFTLQSRSEHPIGRSGQLTSDGAFVGKMQSAFVKNQQTPPVTSANAHLLRTSSPRSSGAVPVAIASKPKEAMATTASGNAHNLLRLMSNPLQLGGQLGVTSQANIVGGSQLSTVLMAGAPITPGSIAIVNPNEKQTSGVAATSTGSQTPSVQQPQVVTLLRQASNMQQPQFVALNANASRQPTQIQYILPTVTLQAAPGGNKVAGLVQMQLPGAQLPAANLQLIQTPTSGLQLVNSMPQLQLVQGGQAGNLQLIQQLSSQAQQLQFVQASSQASNNSAVNVQYVKQASNSAAAALTSRPHNNNNNVTAASRSTLARTMTSQSDLKGTSGSRAVQLKVPLTQTMPMLTKALSAGQSESDIVYKFYISDQAQYMSNAYRVQSAPWLF